MATPTPPKLPPDPYGVEKRYRLLALVRQEGVTRVDKEPEDAVDAWPHLVSMEFIAAAFITILIIFFSVFYNAPLLEQANPNIAENPAKAPWYFLGLQELLHYFPPVVAGVLIPGLVVFALIIIPYFNINVEAEGFFLKDRQTKLRGMVVTAGALSVFLVVFDVFSVLIPTLLIAGLMFLAA